jgi:hypothetical protein
MRSKIALALSILMVVALLSGFLAASGCTSSTTSTGTESLTATGTPEGAEGDNVQTAPAEESGAVEATTVP